MESEFPMHAAPKRLGFSPIVTANRLFPVGSILLVLSWGQAADAQQVSIDGTPVAGSPAVTNQVGISDGSVLTIDLGASIITNITAVIDTVNGSSISVINSGTKIGRAHV